jgi:hypothetical protein
MLSESVTLIVPSARVPSRRRCGEVEKLLTHMRIHTRLSFGPAHLDIPMKHSFNLLPKKPTLRVEGQYMRTFCPASSPQALCIHSYSNVFTNLIEVSSLRETIRDFNLQDLELLVESLHSSKDFCNVV